MNWKGYGSPPPSCLHQQVQRQNPSPRVKARGRPTRLPPPSPAANACWDASPAPLTSLTCVSAAAAQALLAGRRRWGASSTTAHANTASPTQAPRPPGGHCWHRCCRSTRGGRPPAWLLVLVLLATLGRVPAALHAHAVPMPNKEAASQATPHSVMLPDAGCRMGDVCVSPLSVNWVSSKPHSAMCGCRSTCQMPTLHLLHATQRCMRFTTHLLPPTRLRLHPARPAHALSIVPSRFQPAGPGLDVGCNLAGLCMPSTACSHPAQVQPRPPRSS